MKNQDGFIAQQQRNNRDENSTKALSGTWRRDQHFLLFCPTGIRRQPTDKRVCSRPLFQSLSTTYTFYIR